ncbi:hypothetical protein KUCAC02_033256 [Chaenocephalus aceratus]|nr:hypothetical protein KUCAC02_033256 [Chaenocephalus aceratus]
MCRRREVYYRNICAEEEVYYRICAEEESLDPSSYGRDEEKTPEVCFSPLQEGPSRTLRPLVRKGKYIL